MKVNVANVLVDNVTKLEAIKLIDEFVQSGKPHLVVTAYSEFVVFANRDQNYLKVLNGADLSLPDGQGLVWAANFLAGTKVITEKISGSKFIWDIAELASEKGYSMSLVGGQDNVAALSAQALKLKFPNLKINLAVSERPFDAQIVQGIANSNSDILCIAYAPPKQETWLSQNLSFLNVKVAIGLGGTFDYLSGKRKTAPDWVGHLGLEWLWRLITQPWRIRRMWNAVLVFSFIVFKYKFHGRN
ncbi:MAG TPA: WecB/TagA/CpsF family glycosyltransferase [Patescibacteria group bacterium]|nr:WecB/TagA/CpsF family glycosyltransferase [Patescibacteria group bacterium]